MKGDDPELETAQTSKRLDGCLDLQEEIQKTFIDRIPKNKKVDGQSQVAWILKSCSTTGSNVDLVPVHPIENETL